MLTETVVKHFLEKLQEFINNRTPIDIDLSPNRDEVYSGICLKSNDEIFILNCFNEETQEFDGYAIIRSYEIEKYREWDNEESKKIKNNNSSDFINNLPLDKMNNMFDCLLQLQNEKLVAIFTESDDNSYFVGKIKSLSENNLELKLLDENAKWIGKEKLKINEITYIGFKTSYEKSFERRIQ